MVGINIKHPGLFFITFPLADLIFVNWLELFSNYASVTFLPAVAALWLYTIICPEARA